MEAPSAPVATPVMQNNDKNVSAVSNIDCESKRSRNNCGPSLSSILLITFIIIFLFMMISRMSSCYNMDYISGFFTPPEDLALEEISSIPTIELSSIDHKAVELSLKDSFNNDLPNQTNKIPTDDTNYADVAADMALEKSVKDQHQQYVNQREKYTGTASFNPERSDSQDIVTFVGLRRPSYLTKSGDSLVDPTARQVSSVVDPKSLSKPINLSWNYGSFE